MPITRELTPEELQEIEAKGLDSTPYRGKAITLYNDDELQQQPQTTQQKTSTIPQAIGRSLISKAGGILGGGGGVLGSMTLPIAHVAPPYSEILTGAGAALLGGYAGQKAQEKLQGEEKTKQLQAAAAQAEQEHPIATTAADITASALASGGSFKPSNIPKALVGLSGMLKGAALSEADKAAVAAGKGVLSQAGEKFLENRAALQNIAIQSAVNPAIMGGAQYALTGQSPSLKDVGINALGGAAFSGQSRLGRVFNNRINVPEPISEPTQTEAIKPAAPPEQAKTKYTELADGKYIIDDRAVLDQFKALHPKPDTKGMNDVDSAIAESKYRSLMKLPIEEKRNTLEQNFIGQQTAQKKIDEALAHKSITPEPAAEPSKKVEPSQAPKGPTTTPVVTPDIGQIVSGERLPRAEPSTDEQKRTDLQAKVDADNKQFFGEIDRQKKIADFQAARQEEIAQQQKEILAQQQEQQKKPGWTANQERILNPKDILPSEVSRPESFDRNKYTPEQSQRLQLNPNIPKEATVQQHLDRISSDKEDPYAPIAKGLKLDKASASAKVRTTMDDGSPVTRSHYSPDNDTIYLNPIAESSYDALHEIGHAGILKKLPPEWNNLRGYALRDKMNEYLNEGDNPAIKELIKCYYEYAKQTGISERLFGNLKTGFRGIAGNPEQAQRTIGIGGYALGDLHEFTSEAISKPAFQHDLNNRSSGSGDNNSLWSRIVNAFRKMLGLDVKHNSMLERVLKATHEVLEQERPGEQNAIDQRNITGDNREEHIGIQPRPNVPENKEEVRQGEGEETSNRGSNESGKTELKYVPKEYAKKEEIERPYTLKLTSPVIDKVRDINHPLAASLADAAQKTFSGIDQQLGRTQNALQKIIRDVHLTKADDAHLQELVHYENLNHRLPDKPFQNKAQEVAWNKERKIYSEIGAERLRENEPVYRGNSPTLLRVDEHSHPTMLDANTANMLRKRSDVEGIKKFEDRYFEYGRLQGYKDFEIAGSLRNLNTAIHGSMRNEAGSMTYFNAIRRSQGLNIPPEYTMKGWQDNLSSYYNRAAHDMAFYKNVEKNPEAMSALGMDRDSWGKEIPKDPTGGIAGEPSVRTLIQEFRGEIQSAASRSEHAISATATKIFIASPGLQAHIIGSNLIGMTLSGENPYQMSRIIGSAITNFKQGYQHAVENGVMKLTAKSFGNILDANLTFAQRLQLLSHGIGQVATLGDLTTRWNAGLLQAGMEYSVKHTVERANNGNLDAQQNLRYKLDPTYKVGKTYTPEELQKLASVAVGYIHGTGDARTMPGWMLNDSEFSGFFNLAHWSIAQTNKFMADFYTPAKNGNYGPLLNALFGSAVGGYLIKKLREEIQGKHSQIPSLAEINVGEGGLAEHKNLVLYNMISGMQYAGFGGLLSQVAKYPFDYAYKNTPLGATFPMDEIVSNLSDTIGHVSTAMANDPNFNWGKAGVYVAQHIMTDSFQLGRIGYNQAINHNLITGELADKKLLSDKVGQLRRFDMIQGLPYNEIDTAGNPYMNLEQKSFKHTQNIDEAVSMLPHLVENIMQTYADKPDVMMSKLKSLKENQYATMPSLETMPLSMFKYIGYLDRLEGPGAGQSALQDFLMHKTINEAKGKMVPSMGLIR